MIISGFSFQVQVALKCLQPSINFLIDVTRIMILIWMFLVAPKVKIFIWLLTHHGRIKATEFLHSLNIGSAPLTSFLFLSPCILLGRLWVEVGKLLNANIEFEESITSGSSIECSRVLI